MRTYTQKYPVLVEVKVLGRRNKKFWRTSDRANKMFRTMGLTLESQHCVGMYLEKPLHLSNIWVCWRTGSVQLRGVRFVSHGSSIDHMRDDYRSMSHVITEITVLHDGQGAQKLATDFKSFKDLLEKPTLEPRDVFLIVNNCALLPMTNRYNCSCMNLIMLCFLHIM